MKTSRINTLLASCVLLLAFWSCAPSGETSSDLPINGFPPPSSPQASEGERGLNNTTLHFEGTGTFTSDPFLLEEAISLRVKWEQSTQAQFVLSIRNLDESKAESRYGFVIFEFTAASGAGQDAYRLIPGQYVLEIEGESAAWEVWLDATNTVYENQARENEIVRVSGESPGSSISFSVEGGQPVSVDWGYQGAGPFQFSIIRIDAALPYGEDEPILVTDSEGLSSGTMSYRLTEGLYVIDIQLADGPWEISLK